jgi:ribosome biogenesis GTPase
MFDLKTIGLNDYWTKAFHNLPKDLDAGRIVTSYKKRIVVRTSHGDVEGELSGQLQYAAQSSMDIPVVGDWVAVSRCGNKGLIRKIFPRRSVLVRKVSGKIFEKQVLAANIDVAFIVQGLDRDFNLNRLERYMTVIHSGLIFPVIILNKSDLLDTQSAEMALDLVRKRFPEYRVFLTSAKIVQGVDALNAYLTPGLTFCLIGSSGVGKSSLINALAGDNIAQTGELSRSTSKGAHITTRRELHILKNGSILMDTPGLREIGIADAASGLEKTFPLIYDAAMYCRFDDCLHVNEPECAVKKAVEEGVLEEREFLNFLELRLETEQFHKAVTEKERRKSDKKNPGRTS